MEIAPVKLLDPESPQVTAYAGVPIHVTRRVKIMLARKVLAFFFMFFSISNLF
jgi:hypothetical protein